MPYQAIIFDFNGVLLWDSPLHEAAWRQASVVLRGWPLTDDEMAHHVHGRVNQDIFSYVLGRPVDSADALELSESKERIYRELCLSAGVTFALSPGAVELLDWLKESNIPCTIATSSAWPNVAFYFDRLQLDTWFDPETIAYDQGRYPGKPAPHIYRHAAELLGLVPGECIVVEDSFAGIASAHAADIGHSVALGPAEHHERLRSLDGVATVIEDLGRFPRGLLEVPRR